MLKKRIIYKGDDLVELPEATFNVFVLGQTGETCIFFLPPRDHILFFVSAYPNFTHALSEIDKSRSQVLKSSVQEAWCKHFSGSPPFLLSSSGPGIHFICPIEMIDHFYHYFRLQIEAFGSNAFSLEHTSPFVARENWADELEAFVSDCDKNSKTSNLWNLLEAENGKREVFLNLLSELQPMAQSELKPSAILAVRAATQLSWPLLPGEEHLPDISFPFEMLSQTLSYPQEVQNLYTRLKQLYPVIFSDLTTAFQQFYRLKEATPANGLLMKSKAPEDILLEEKIAVPIWIYALDEEGVPGQDESWEKPIAVNSSSLSLLNEEYPLLTMASSSGHFVYGQNDGNDGIFEFRFWTGEEWDWDYPTSLEFPLLLITLAKFEGKNLIFQWIDKEDHFVKLL